MGLTTRQGGAVMKLGSADLKDYLVRRLGVQQATTVYGYQQMLMLHGPAELQRILGPERYVEILITLRQAGLEV